MPLIDATYGQIEAEIDDKASGVPTRVKDQKLLRHDLKVGEVTPQAWPAGVGCKERVGDVAHVVTLHVVTNAAYEQRGLV
jgi:hypothetical protein